MKKQKLLCTILVLATMVSVGCSTNKDKSNVTTNINSNSKEVQQQDSKTAQTDGSSESGAKMVEGGNVTNNSDTNKDTVAGEDTSNSDITASSQATVSTASFIPNGEYEVEYKGSDLAAQVQYIKGNGTSYEEIGVNGKGSYINVYSSEGTSLKKIYKGDLTDEEMANKASIDYLSKGSNADEEMLQGPITVGTRWGNKEIVEVGQNLKLGELTLPGTYVKTWEKEDGKDGLVVKVYYYSEGLGCVDYRAMMNDEIVDYSTLTSYVKK